MSLGVSGRAGGRASSLTHAKALRAVNFFFKLSSVLLGTMHGHFATMHGAFTDQFCSGWATATFRNNARTFDWHNGGSSAYVFAA